MNSRRALIAQQLDFLWLLLGGLLLVDLTTPSMLGAGADRNGREVKEGWMSVAVVSSDLTAPGLAFGREIELVVLDEAGNEVATNRDPDPDSTAPVRVKFVPGDRIASFHIDRPATATGLRLMARVTSLEPTLLANASYMKNVASPTRLVVYPTVEQVDVNDELESGGLAASRPSINLAPAGGSIGVIDLPDQIPASN